jgi:hypothetical protein
VWYILHMCMCRICVTACASWRVYSKNLIMGQVDVVQSTGTNAKFSKNCHSHVGLQHTPHSTMTVCLFPFTWHICRMQNSIWEIKSIKLEMNECLTTFSNEICNRNENWGKWENLSAGKQQSLASLEFLILTFLDNRYWNWHSETFFQSSACG